MNRTIRLEKMPERIVSLVPSQTELLFDLGLGDRVVGITRFCVHPESWHRSKTRVGGTKNVNLQRIHSLNPDLIIGNKEENTPQDIMTLAEKYPVYLSDIYTVPDAIRMISDLGVLVSKSEESRELTGRIEADFASFPRSSGTVLYLIWAEPFMAAGNHTFIGDILKRFGLINAIAGEFTRYQEITEDEIRSLKPDFIFLSSEPFPFKPVHAETLKQVTKAAIHFVDGELFSWYGSRMTRMKDYFTDLSRQMKDNWP